MLTENINALAEELEKQELEAINGVALPQTYERLLAIYLYQNDLCNAKYLWKRIPPTVKANTTELGQIWAVAQHMWQRDFAAVYKALNTVKWSDTVAEIMMLVQDKVRSRAVDLISQAYSSITLDTIASMTGLTIEVAGGACMEKGWHIEADTHIVRPIRPKIENCGHISSEDQLFKLTDFVSFLEN
ncbi:cop9 signalosome complex subunit 8 [Holotrichia oblita]|uniref:Cop9 signalosome complex subunit 8 n=1 Tax=Holotrichia oblita TaxID=644536 RepID=A0ACB9TE16_HOLOL|nr:cop9 signalosome complex subunit 8 [Holotrichia oblita]